MRYRFFIFSLLLSLQASVSLAVQPDNPGPPPGVGPPNPPPGYCSNTAQITATTTGISFGDIGVTTGGSVTVDPTGFVSASGGVILLGGITNAAIFDVTGCADYSYTVVLPATVTLTSTNGSMVMDNIVSTPNGSGLLDATGYQQINVGGRLNINSGQVSGAYSGTFIVEVVF